jgi:hypothetical protein
MYSPGLFIANDFMKRTGTLYGPKLHGQLYMLVQIPINGRITKYVTDVRKFADYNYLPILASSISSFHVIIYVIIT